MLTNKLTIQAPIRLLAIPECLQDPNQYLKNITRGENHLQYTWLFSLHSTSKAEEYRIGKK